MAGPLYGVVPGDPAASEELRARRRKERAAGAVPVREWMVPASASGSSRGLHRAAAADVRRVPAALGPLGGRVPLLLGPDGFDYDIETPEVDIARALIAQQ